MKRTTRVAIVLAVSTMLAACGEQATQPAHNASPTAGAGSLPDPVDGGEAGSLHQRAAQALADQRMVSPAGRNAVEYYLAARREDAGDDRAQAALLELQPYLLIAVEQALARGDASEAARLLSLVTRIDTNAPALPRLKAALAGLQQAQTAQREAEARTASVPLPASPVAPASVPAVSAVAAPAPPVPSPSAARMTASVESAATTTETPPATRAPDAADGVALSAAPRAATTRAPRLLQDVPPRYPLPALRAGMEGQAEVAFTIQPDGSVRNVQLVSSTPPGVFDASAVAVAQRWRFEATGQVHALRRTVLFRLPASEAGGG
jgi:protein TonB